jgi:SAM-dependent methyltransferase
VEAATATSREQAAREALARNRVWYHTIELAPGIATPGQIDWRNRVTKILPDDLQGLRALDVGTFDGFWAFEMEKRGAEVTAVDLPGMESAEWNPLRRETLLARRTEMDLELGQGFAAAKAALGAKAERLPCNVYDLSPDVVGGAVDVIFLGAILLHLRDPVRGLEQVRATLKPGGRLISLEPFSVRETITGRGRAVARFETLFTDFNWWRPNLAGLAAWIGVAGFVDIRRSGFHRPPSTKSMREWHTVLNARNPG